MTHSPNTARPQTKPYARSATVCATLALAFALGACAPKVRLNDSAAQGAAGSNTTQTDDADSRAVANVAAPSTSVDMSQAEAAQRLVYFDYDSYAIKPEFEALMQKNAAYLKADPKRTVALEGHADVRGGREYNLALGQKRADAVKQALNLLGVSETQMEAISFGKEKPVALGMDEDSHAQNRRVEIVYK